MYMYLYWQFRGEKFAKEEHLICQCSVENEKITLISMNKFSWNQLFSNFLLKRYFHKFLSKNSLDAEIQDKSTSISIVVKFK